MYNDPGVIELTPEEGKVDWLDDSAAKEGSLTGGAVSADLTYIYKRLATSFFARYLIYETWMHQSIIPQLPARRGVVG